MAFDQQQINASLREGAIEYLLRGGASVEQVCNVIRKMYMVDQEDFDDEFIEKQVLTWQEVINEETNKPKRSVSTLVDDWMGSNASNKQCDSNVTVSLQQCYSDLGLKSPNEKTACRMAFKRMVEAGKLEPSKHKAGMYRYINGNMEELDFMNADTTPFDIKFPMGVHELVAIYKKSLVVLAGEPNAGKTAYLLNVARKNMAGQRVNYFSSEMGAAELQIRLKKFNIPLESWKKCRFVAKSGDFKDVIDPNGLNIIDYLEVAKDFYEIGGLLTDIFNALDKGVAVVGLQKPAGRDTGVGGARTLDKARLYLSIEPGVLKIVKGKLWRQECVNPNGMSIRWSLGGGANFKIIPDNDGSEWRRP